MVISLDNQGEGGWVFVQAESIEEAEKDGGIDGSFWKSASGHFAYTLLMDRPSLIDELRAEGYKLDLSCYSPPVWRETLWGLVDAETGQRVALQV